MSAPFGDEAGDTRLHLSAMQKLYRRKRRDGGGLRLDMGEITAVEIFDGGFPELADHVLHRLRYPHATATKQETYAWVPATYQPTEDLRRTLVGPQWIEGYWRNCEHEAPRLCLMYGDIDNKDDDLPHAAERELADRLAAACERPVRFFTYTTWSSAPGRRKFRVVYDTSRWLTRGEMLRCHVPLNELVYGRQGDASIYNPGGMIFGPPHGAETTRHEGAPLDVDRLLSLEAALREAEPEAIAVRYDRRRLGGGAEPKPGVAAQRAVLPPTPEEQAAARQLMADASQRSGFRGIDDPAVFNPVWRNDFARAAVQGSHYATMLSLLGRVWRKTGGTLSHGEMLAVYEGIDATGSFYMRGKYGEGKAREMIGFVMSRPVADHKPIPLDPRRLLATLRRWRKGRGGAG